LNKSCCHKKLEQKLFPSGHDVQDEGDVVVDVPRLEDEATEKAKFMLQTLAFNKKVSWKSPGAIFEGRFQEQLFSCSLSRLKM
jgi:hypothetical protein